VHNVTSENQRPLAQQTMQDSFSDYKIFRIINSKSFAVKVRENYYPVYYTETFELNQHVMSFEVTAVPHIKNTLSQSLIRA
jgi:hypothetical protein